MPKCSPREAASGLLRTASVGCSSLLGQASNDGWRDGPTLRLPCCRTSPPGGSQRLPRRHFRGAPRQAARVAQGRDPGVPRGSAARHAGAAPRARAPRGPCRPPSWRRAQGTGGRAEAPGGVRAARPARAPVRRGGRQAGGRRAADQGGHRQGSGEECRQRLSREEEALADRRRAAERRGAEVDALLGLYSERLGLRCERLAPQTVRMVFTLVDPSEPLREFSFSLGLDGSFEYSAFGCSPAVRDLDERVATLNAGGHSKCALPAFLCGMRRAFRAGAAAREQ
ncbi:unnamed protein product [Prorocentrum cordatum]|uniref:Kinetochore protein SPC25 n=1 Tax=Prorocentrum cordatum TaxID=2364126 RepID=A0ABN9Y3Y9_9DINO|nr:unnamed protein product [Polarella glacialis]